MRKSTKMLVLTMALGYVMAAAVPAQAATVGVAVFIGKANLASPICAPVKLVTGCPQPGGLTGKAPIAFNMFAPNTHLGLACIGAYVSAKKTPPAEVDTECAINVAGTVDKVGPLGPWCGLSTGSNIGGAITIGGKTTTVSNGSWIGVGGTLIVTGTASKGGQTGVFASVVNAAPDALKGSSCVTNGATSFIVVGVAVAAATGNK